MTLTTVKSASNIHPNKLRFIEGVGLIFDSWTALRLAIQMEFAGSETLEKAQWLRCVIVEHFDSEGKNVEPEDLEDILLDVMSREFHMNLEDNSEREIARLLFDLYRECIRGEYFLLEKLKAKALARAARLGDVLAQSQMVVETDDTENFDDFESEDGEYEDGEEEEGVESDMMDD